MAFLNLFWKVQYRFLSLKGLKVDNMHKIDHKNTSVERCVISLENGFISIS